MNPPLILYSTCTWLAYKIAQFFYRDEHYVWCTPHFSADSLSSWESSTPPSSTPLDIYNAYHEEVIRGDRHGAHIAANKAGILRGAHLKANARIITKKQKAEIFTIVQKAELNDFRPLLFIIPYGLIQDIIEEVPVIERAHPLSVEFVIQQLPRNCFDVVQFHKR
ncbi:MAG: hypothetical protein QOG71_3865 [Pyrinomonadaceae bacterium]|nr:hypothetical protein [Pyrinomonadaceae bacterium]